MKIAFLLSRIPWPLDKGDKLRAYYQLRELSQSHEIHLIALYESKIPEGAQEELKKYCSSIHFFRLTKLEQLGHILLAYFKGLPLQNGYFYSRRIHQNIRKLLKAENIDLVFTQLVRMAPYAHKESYTKILDYQDTLSVGLERRAALSKGIKQLILHVEGRRMKKYEAAIFSAFDACTIITQTDRDLLPFPEKHQVHIIPNGVDMERFRARSTSKKYDLVFAGNMNYPPNVDAVLYLVNEIMPLVWGGKSEINLLIAGANPAPAVKNCASEKVHVSGWMDDIADAYADSKIFIAPMRMGTGLQNKLLEAMSMNLACITTPLANAALGAQADIEIKVGETAQELAYHILTLVKSNETRNEIAGNGHAFIQRNYSWKAVKTEMEALFAKLKTH